MKPPVERRVNRAQLPTGEKQIEVFDTITRQDRNPISLTDTFFVL
jgi:hypothetical protein